MKISFTVTSIGLAAMLVCGTRPALGVTSSGFRPSTAAWRSTDIMVIDVNGSVEEVWRGTVKVGDRIDIKQLGVSSRVLYYPSSDYEEGDSRYIAKGVQGSEATVEASHMILFLHRSEDGEWKGTTGNTGDDARYAVVWRVDGTLWCWNSRYMYPSQFGPLPIYTNFKANTFDELKDYVASFSSKRTALEKANEIPDEKTRAENLSLFVSEDCLPALRDALDYLSTCGVAALPVFRELLFDENIIHRHDEIMRPLMKACGKDAKDLLTDVIKDEVAYWQKKGGLLKDEWGRGTSVSLENGHYRRLWYALYYLTEADVLSLEDVPLLQTASETMAALPEKEVFSNKDYIDDDDRMRMLFTKALNMARSKGGAGQIPEERGLGQPTS